MSWSRAILLLIISVSVLLVGCEPETTEKEWSANTLHQLNYALTEAIVHDGFSPPVASRIYAYTAITAYESLAINNDEIKSAVDQLRDYESSTSLKPEMPVNNEVVLVESFRIVAAKMLYRGYVVDSTADKLLLELEALVSPEVYSSSIKTAENLAALVLARGSKDNYGKTRNMAKYEPSTEPGKWVPTGPTFGESLEPYWHTVNTLVLDSANQIKVPDPIPFETDSASAFYKLAIEVYEYTNSAIGDSSKELISKFWDCNPQKTNIKGHMMFKTRQLTPGGHWVRIAQQACQADSLSLLETAKVHAYVGIALMDGFIGCWHEKYRTDLIRPETYIQKYIDPDWMPILETPLFPEHPSGHSVVSAASATVLTSYFGDSYAFTDSAEVDFGMPLRSFGSFREASNEAALSRLYGGIHYTPAADQGIEMGNAIGNAVLSKVKL